ncbi:hypothetical protein M9Y10_035849 [Tritrichomonas musculus]|uniref:Ubiquitin-like domain-containing protein n=1 Tax=Tritrichomonas musculus TaxID=1915356 RepID=A0ABR2GVF8_9EUKA
MQIYVNEKPEGKKIPLVLEPTNSIDDLKDKLRSIDKRYQDILALIYDHTSLEDGKKSLHDYSIQDNATIDLYYSFQYLPIYLDIITFDGKSIKLYCDPLTNIGNIKQYIQTKFNVPEGLNFVSCHDILQEDKRLNQYYRFSSPIFLAPQPTPDKKSVIIKLLNGNFRLIEISQTAIIGDIKSQIQTVENVPANQQRLLFKDIFLEDQKSIQDYSLPDYPILLMIPRPGGEDIDISVVYLTNKELLIKADSKDTIGNLKIMINFIDKHPINMQCLSYKDVQLDDDQKTLESYSVVNGAKLNIVLSYRG